MWQRLILMVGVFAAAGILGGVAFAQLGNKQQALGNITVTAGEPGLLYICEPGSTPGPDCGSDDSDGDEIVFETVENLLPGERVQWDIRLKNVSTETWRVTAGGEGDALAILEANDPGDDCPDDALSSPFPASVSILGKGGDEENDNRQDLGTLPASFFLRESTLPSQQDRLPVIVAPGDYEDLRLRLEMRTHGTDNCAENEWAVSWGFAVAPTGQ